MSRRPLKVFLAVGCIALAAGLVVGISDNIVRGDLVLLRGNGGDFSAARRAVELDSSS
jgi:hypothetical protein